MKNQLSPEIENFQASFDKRMSPSNILGTFKDPVFIVGAPRSGSTLLFNILSKAPNIWTIGGESHQIYGHFPHLAMENSHFDSGSLGKKHADKKTANAIRALYAASIYNREGEKFIDRAKKESTILFLEKTPRNALNIPFLKTIYPSARFIYLYRDAKENVSSIIETWQKGRETGQFVTYRDLPDWPLGYWCLLLPRHWRSMKHKSIAEIACFQWQSCNEIIIDELKKLPDRKWISISYNDVVENTEQSINRLCSFLGCEVDNTFDNFLRSELPLSETVVTKPKSNKWKRHEKEIIPLLSIMEKTEKIIETLAQ